MPSSAWSGGERSVCGNAKEKDEEGVGEDARGQISTSPRGAIGWGVVVGGGMGLVQDQLVENGVCVVVVVVVVGVGVSHSDSAWWAIAFRRCLRMRDAARADEGKVVVSGEDSEEDEEEKELEDIVKWWGRGGRGGEFVVREEVGSQLSSFVFEGRGVTSSRLLPVRLVN